MTSDLRRYTKPVPGSEELLVAERPEWTPRGLVARMALCGSERHPDGHMVDRRWYLGTVNLTSVQERLTFQRLLTGMMTHAWVDAAGDTTQHLYEPQLLWEMAAFFDEILDGEAQTAEPVILGEDPTVGLTATPIHELGALSLLAAHPTIFFGEGESGKSYVWAYLAGQLALMGEQVLILDYELDEADHTDRLRRMFGDVPPLHYLKCSTPLPELVPFVRDYALRHGITYLVVDSIAPACGAEAEASETANRYFTALQDIGVAGSLHIAHRSKASYDRKGEEKPFGSNFWHNLARETYPLLTVEERTPTSRVLTVSCRKANLRAYPVDVKTVLTFVEDVLPRVDIEMTSITVSPMDARKAHLVRALGVLAQSKVPLPFDSWRKQVGLPQTPKDLFMVAFQDAQREQHIDRVGLGWRVTASGLQLVQA